MVVHHAAIHALAGMKAQSGHHVGATAVSRGGGGGGGGHGGGSAAASVAEYVVIFATIKALGYGGATFLWATTMGALVGGPVGGIVGSIVAAEAAKDVQADLEAAEAQEVEDQKYADTEECSFKDLEYDMNKFEKDGEGRLWYIAKSGERSLVDSIKYDRVESKITLDCGRLWQIPIKKIEEEKIVGELRALCNKTGTQHEGLRKSRPMTAGEKQVADRGCCGGLVAGCGVGALCGVGVAKTVLACGDCGGNSLASNVAQTLMIKHVTCPAAICGGCCGGVVVGCVAGKCAHSCSSESS